MNAPHFIDNHWVAGEGRDTLVVYDPSLAQPFSDLRAASSAQVDLAACQRAY